MLHCVQKTPTKKQKNKMHKPVYLLFQGTQHKSSVTCIICLELTVMPHSSLPTTPISCLWRHLFGVLSKAMRYRGTPQRVMANWPISFFVTDTDSRSYAEMEALAPRLLRFVLVCHEAGCVAIRGTKGDWELRGRWWPVRPDVLLNPYERPVSLKVTRNVFSDPEKPLCTSETGPLLQKCPPGPGQKEACFGFLWIC